jgi:hypothetical protein
LRSKDDSEPSVNSKLLWDAVELFIHDTNELGTLRPASRVFVALAIVQVAKRNGSRESELSFLTDLSNHEVKQSLEQLERLHLLRICPPSYLIPTTTAGAKVYLPSNWAKGKPVERLTGPRVPSYTLDLNTDFTVSSFEVKFKASIEEILLIVRKRIEQVEDQVWHEYVRFAKIVLTEVRACSLRARGLYGEFMPRKIDDSVSFLLRTFDEIESKCDTRKSALVLLERATRLLRESLTEVHGIS